MVVPCGIVAGIPLP